MTNATRNALKKAARNADAPRVVIGYMRVSTAGQVTEGVALEAQRARISAYATAQGCRLAEVFEDAGVSGAHAANRPGLQAALAAVCKAKGVLVVYSLSRMARSTQDALSISKQLERAGADLVSLSESLDTTSAAGKMVFRMLTVLAEFERDLVGERTSSALAHLRRQGRRISRHVPYGFADDGTGHLVEVPAERDAVAQILRLDDDGASLRGIIAALDARGIKPRTANTWSAETIRGIIGRARIMA